MPQSILYYPSINIKDGPWLRGAALYWNQVRSIVPYEGYDDFSPEIAYMAERGHYRPLYPKDIFILSDPDHFMSLAKKYLNCAHLTKLSTLSGNRGACGRQIQDDSLTAFLHYQKVPTDFLDTLIRQGNVTLDGEWIEASEAFVFQYMKLLADYVVNYSSENIVLGSDAKRKFYEIYSWKEKEPTGIEISLQQCLPVPGPEVSFEQILDFKERHQQELTVMESKLLMFEDELRHSENSLDLKSAVFRFRSEWSKSIRDLTVMSAESSMQIFMGNLCAFIGGVEATEKMVKMITGSTDIPKVIATVLPMGAGAIALKNTYCQFRRRNQDRKSKDYGYILSAKRGGILQLNSGTEWI